ncbi:RNA methyltransferase [Spirochaetia bacterium 38H-sp]|uniref:tRNA (guanosine(18)-2'-O)-methyltransferase n=1 Tax=Rarispira pelagica TaxID=3141764 RepID=A0ABU9UCL1_9SPIR
MERTEILALTEYLKQYVTSERLARMEEILSLRTRYIVLGLENIYHPHNANAVLRTCDAMGVQDIHIIEDANRFSPSDGVALGTSKWLSLYRYKSAETAIAELRKSGYRIIATTPHHNPTPLEEVDIEAGPCVFFFGGEVSGLREVVLDNADEYLAIPMYGFVESLNISVSAGMVLQSVVSKLRKSSVDWRLSDYEREELLLDWLRKSIRNVDAIEKRFYGIS